MADERRQIQRKNSIFYLEACDLATDLPLGRLIDITTRGMMLMSPTPIETNKHFQIRISLPPKLSKGDFLDIDCRSAWCRLSINPDFRDTGFEFADLSDQENLIIELLIKYFSFTS